MNVKAAEQTSDAAAINSVDGASDGCGDDINSRCAQHHDVSSLSLSSPSNITAASQSHHPSDATPFKSDDATLKMTRIVKTAEIPPKDSDRSPSNDIFERHCLHGGPVTAATIRFPPPECMEVVNNDAKAEEHNAHQEGEDQYHFMKSQGRIVLARGPWIETYPLFPSHDANNDGDDINPEAEASHHNMDMDIDMDESTAKDFHTSCNIRSDHSSSSSNPKKCHKILAFGSSSHGSSTIEGVHGMIFPSSSPSLAYLNETNSTSSSRTRSTQRRRTASSLISVMAYGGRRMSFLSGGGLWDTDSGRGGGSNDNGATTTSQEGNGFAHIPIIQTKNQKTEEYPYLEVSDWIHDVRLLDVDSTGASSSSKTKNEMEGFVTSEANQQQQVIIASFLLAMGMANNNAEIWGFHTISMEDGKRIAFCPTRLQCITCSVRCMTYSLSFYGWDVESQFDGTGCSASTDDSDGSKRSASLHSLVAASGTVFGDIVVWGVVRDPGDDNKTQMEDSDDLTNILKMWFLDTITKGSSTINSLSSTSKSSRIRVAPSYHLKGHLGSVFSVKFGGCGNYIASTSDDRSVRLWALTPVNQSLEDDTTEEKTHLSSRSAKEILSSESTHNYTLIWTGWGHTARVWDVSFSSSSSFSHQSKSSHPLLVSAGEDSTARIWSPLSSKKEITHPLRGHRCESLWTVDVCEGIIVTGGNDGCVKLFEMDSRVRSDEKSVITVVVPKDPQPATPAAANGESSTGQTLMKAEETVTSTGSTSRKKKAKKRKLSGQAIFGMKFYGCQGKVQNKLLVATRAGGLFSLDLISHAWTDYSSWSQQVVLSSDSETIVPIDPSSGSCIGVHPSGDCVVVGTTKGWLITSNFSNSDLDHSTKNKNVAFQAPSYRPVQSISFIDNDSMLVFYARGSIIWFQFGESPTPIHVMTLGTTGIPLSFAYNDKDHAMYIGDSRGNIALFDLSQPLQSITDNSQELQERSPSSLINKIHGKEHVTGITVVKSTGAIISIGNDGCMHQCNRDVVTGQLQKMTSIPIPNVTGLRHIWNVSHHNNEENTIVGGFYGNDFVMLDSIRGYEFLRIATGGRQRQQDFFFAFARNSASLRCPNIFGKAILTGQKNGFNAIDIHCSAEFEKSLAILETSAVDNHVSSNIQTPYSIGTPVHSETINDACWVKAGGSTYLLTGSNDCTVKLSILDNKNNVFLSVIELPPHESCVRGVCSSCHSNSNSTLLATCGGKQSMEFYILNHASHSNSTSNESQVRCCVSLICSYRTLGKATIDHRLNAVRATPLHPRDMQCHLALSGDSDGNLHMCLVSEHAPTRRTTIGTIFKGNGRPVICLELLRSSEKILAFVGTTGGEIAVWVFPGSISLSDEGAGVHCLTGIIPTAPAYIFSAHQTGVNDLSVAIASSHSSTDGLRVLVCSVGDDQAMSTHVLDFTGDSHHPNGLLRVKGHISLVTEGASASALKAIKLVAEKEAGFFRVFTTGHDERITLWQLDANLGQLSIRHLLSSPLGTEGSCIDCVHLAKSNGSVHEFIAVCGEGVELQSFDLNILHAAKTVREANFLLITTGAGFSADSGLQTYECAPAEYRDMCNPSKLTDNPYQFQQFWLKFTQSYLSTKPHKGYELLHQWCQGGQLKHLKSLSSQLDDPHHSSSLPWWVYSSNVDGHFRRFESFGNSLCEIHGSALEFRCACGIGYSNGEPRIGKEWDQWNQKMISTSSCKQMPVQMSQDQATDIINSGEIFLCNHCHQAMRPNVLMFHDTDENVLKAINIQRERYQAWEDLVEEKVATMGGKLVILEMGCGVNVPAVRQESEEVLLDCAKKMESESASHGSVCLIRINPKDAEIEMSDGGSFETISISSTAAMALHKIDCWLKTLSRDQKIE